MLTKFSVRRPLTIIMVVLMVIILGVVSLMGMTTDLFPSINLPYAIIITSYDNASPEQVEMFLTRPIEQSMASVSNVSSVSSVSNEEISIIIMEFTQSTNMDSVVMEMRESLDMMMSYMPAEVSSPMILKLNPDMMPVMVLSIGVEGQSIGESSKWLENKIIPEFESVEGVASVSSSGMVTNQIHILLDNDEIEKLNEDINELILKNMMANMPTIPIDPTQDMQPVSQEMSEMEPILTEQMISGMLIGQNFSMPSGYLNEENKSYLVRVGDKLDTLESIENIPVFSMEGFKTIYLKDIASVAMIDDADTIYAKVNGNDAIMLTVQKQTEYATSDIAKAIRDKMEELEEQYSDVILTQIMDQGEYIDMVINGVGLNLLIGAALAILILLIFLRDIRPTLIVGMAIPISLITAFVLMYFAGVTLNVVSMGGLALGVGMLVDNSIVVIENIYRMRNEGKSAKKAAVQGALQVAGAITASTLTTICVFLPIVFTEGMTREIFTDMGLTIGFSLIASLVIALTFVPMAAANIIRKDKRSHKGLSRIQTAYEKVLRSALKHKLVVVFLVVILLAGSIYGALSNGTEYFPASDSGQLNMEITFDSGTSFDDATTLLEEINDKLVRIDDIETIGATIGGNMMLTMMGGGGGSSKSSTDSATMYVLLTDDRSSTTMEISQEIRDLTEDINCDIEIRESGMDMSALSGGAIVVEVLGREFNALESIATDVEEIVLGVEGTTEVNNGISKGAPELNVSIDVDEAIKYSLTPAQIYGVVNAVLATERSVTTLSNENGDYDVIVTNDTDKEFTKSDLENLMITTPTGDTVKLSSVAEVVETVGYSSIRRSNQQRSITITAEIEEDYNIGNVASGIQDILDDYEVPDGYSVELTGQNQLIEESFSDLFLLLGLAIALIYMIMVAQFHSLKSPFIVMFTIPLAFTGGFIALIATGMPISIVSFVGMIILSGVVVNNGIVFIDYINKLRESGMKLRKAIIKAGHARLRPIIMTALTTIIALSMMTLGTSMGTELIQPMAITAVGGLIYATLLTLVLVPVLYEAFHKKKKEEKA